MTRVESLEKKLRTKIFSKFTRIFSLREFSTNAAGKSSFWLFRLHWLVLITTVIIYSLPIRFSVDTDPAIGVSTVEVDWSLKRAVSKLYCQGIVERFSSISKDLTKRPNSSGSRGGCWRHANEENKLNFFGKIERRFRHMSYTRSFCLSSVSIIMIW